MNIGQSRYVSDIIDSAPKTFKKYMAQMRDGNIKVQEKLYSIDIGDGKRSTQC